jgi:hypothetical protein
MRALRGAVMARGGLTRSREGREGWFRNGARRLDHERHESHERGVGRTRTQSSGTRFGVARGWPRIGTDDHGKGHGGDVAQRVNHERHELHKSGAGRSRRVTLKDQ